MKRLLQRPLFQAALARVLGSYLAFALRTTRWSLDGAEHMAPHAAGAPVIVAFWHERLSMMPMLWLLARKSPQGSRSNNRVHVLVSRHRDGQFIGAVVNRFALDVVLGSSSRGGAKGLRTLLNLLAGGDHIAITPDGPRGPRREAAPGVAQLAALSSVPVLPCAAQTTRRWVLPSWDRMHLAWRWLTGLGFDQEIPHHSTFSKNRHGARLLRTGSFGANYSSWNCRTSMSRSGAPVTRPGPRPATGHARSGPYTGSGRAHALSAHGRGPGVWKWEEDPALDGPRRKA